MKNKNNKTKTITFRLTGKEYQRLVEKAEKANMYLGQYIRYLLTQKNKGD